MAGVFGSINNPLQSGYGDVNPGLPNFISNVVKVIFIAAGLYAFFNLMIAGITYITANGDKGKLENALYSINMSLIGLVILAGAAIITGIVSFLLYNDATAILRPNIVGPGTP